MMSSSMLYHNNNTNRFHLIETSSIIILFTLLILSIIIIIIIIHPSEASSSSSSSSSSLASHSTTLTNKKPAFVSTSLLSALVSSSSSSSTNNSTTTTTAMSATGPTPTTPTQSSVNNDWNAMAGEWDDMGAPKQYSDSFLELLLKQQIGFLNATNNNNDDEERIIVDFGCGTGLLTENLKTAAGGSAKCVTYVCIDPASAMASVVQDKILAHNWTDNTRVHCVALANLDQASPEIQKDIKETLMGKVDLIVASSVMSFVPKADLPATMKILGGLLKSGGSGLFVHSDWPKSDSAPDGFTAETAKEMYEMGGLTVKSALNTKFKMGSEEADVFFGVAEKP